MVVLLWCVAVVLLRCVCGSVAVVCVVGSVAVFIMYVI